MRQSFGISDMMGEARMDRSEMTHILLEAEKEDCMFNKFRVRPSRVRYMGGKDDVLDKAKALNREGKRNFFGIVDSDFDRILSENPTYPSNVYPTDTHDQETMIFSSKALSNFLKTYAIDEELDAFESHHKNELINILLDGTLTLACIPMIGFRHGVGRGYGYSTKYLILDDYEYFVSKEDLSIEVEALLSIQNRINRGLLPISKDHLIDIKEELTCNMNINQKWQVCNGHHMARILTVGLNHIFGRKPFPTFTFRPEDVERKLALLYDFEIFSRTQLCRSILDWEKRNQRKALDI